MDYISKRQQYQILYSALSNERSTFLDHWRDLSDHIRPRRSRFQVTDRNKGDRRSSRIVDSTATFAARTLQSGLHAGITSPARQWMRLTTPDPELAEHGPVKEWLHTVTQRMMTVFLRSNLYNALPILYGDVGVFGTGVMAVLEDEHDFIRCVPYPIGSYMLGVSSRGVVDTCFREWQMTVRQVIDFFGRPNGQPEIDWSHLSDNVKKQYDDKHYDALIEVCWVVTPNPDFDPERLEPKYMRFHSCHYEKAIEQEEKFLRESGFNEFPVLAPRWDVTGHEDIYGTSCPGMDCLGDVHSLMLMQKRKAQLVEIGINPSVQAPTHLKNQPVSLLPGGVTYADMTQGHQGIRPIREVNLAALQFLISDIQDTREMIRRAFHEDLFLMLAQSDRREITAREIEERHEEKLLALGPVLERMNDELLDPLIDRVYAMMERAGMIPEPPDDLSGMALKVEYTSLMAQAQKLVGVVGQDRLLQSVLPLADVWPEVKYKIDPLQLVDDYGDMLGVNPKIIVPDDEARAAIDAAQQAAAQQRQIEQEAMAAKGVRDLSQAPTDQPSALQQIMEGAQA